LFARGREEGSCGVGGFREREREVFARGRGSASVVFARGREEGERAGVGVVVGTRVCEMERGGVGVGFFGGGVVY
jgi:hypothetical protein